MADNASAGFQCQSDPPTAELLLLNLDATAGALYVVQTVMALAGVLVYLEETLYITRKIPASYKRTTYIWVTGAPPVIAATSCVALWIPRSSMFTDFTASIYFTICLHKFLVMMVEEYGGDEAFVRRLRDIPLRVSTGPCCCCCLCLPPLDVNMRTLTLLKWGTLQAALLRPVLMFFATVLWTNGTYQQGRMEVSGAFLWITVLSVAAFLLSLWPIAILFTQARTNLAQHNIGAKFALNQCVVILSQAQGGIISLLVATGTIICAPPFSARARGAFMHQQLMVMEMFLLIITSRCYYRRRYSDPEPDMGLPDPFDQQDAPKSLGNGDTAASGGPLVTAPQWV